MLDTTEIFLSEFHNLNGVKIGERKKNLYSLLKKQSFSEEEKQSIIENLKPKTYLETLFRIDVLIYFKKTSQLLEILKDGNEVFVSKIIKQPWFFQEAFINYTAEEFVQNLLPSMSFSVKKKLLTKLPLIFSEQQIDKVFDRIVNRYGLFFATSVVHNCSAKKIEHILKNNDIKLSTCQLKVIYKKQPDLINIYFEEHKDEVDKRIDNCFLVFVAQRDPNLFCILTKEYKKERKLRLGRRTTKQLINSKKNEIICEPEKYVQFLKNETFVRKLNKKGELKKIYHALFPRNISIFKEESYNILSYTLLKFYPRRARYQLFAQTFESVFNDDVLANFNCINDYLLDINGDRNFREKLAQLKYKETNNHWYLKYYKTENCFKLLREKIHFTSSIITRSELVWILGENCFINKDLEALEKALQYFCERHRNDDNSIKRGFLERVQRFDHKTFNDTHWKYINEIIITLRLDPDYYPINPGLRLKYLEFLYKENKLEEIETALLEYMKDEVKRFSINYTLSSLKNPEFEKKILLEGIQVLPKAIEMENLDNVAYDLKMTFVSEIFAYNKRHPKSKINISGYQQIVNILREIMTVPSTSHMFNTLLVQEIRWLNRNDFENELVNYYWKHIFPLYPADKFLLWYIKHDPLLIVQHFEDFIHQVSQTGSKVYYRIKLYSHINLDDMVLKYSTKQFTSIPDYSKKIWIRPLAILGTSEDYIQFIENANLIPTTPKLDLTNKETSYNILTKTFIENFINVKDPLIILPFLIEKFCIGDYLGTSLCPLYSLFYKSPENALKPFVDKLLQNKNTSVRKHSLYFACSIFDQQTVLDILTIFGQTKDTALHKRAFLSCMKYFSKNPSKEFLTQITFYTKLLHESDTESFLTLSTTKIPRKFKPEYIQSIWNILETFNANNKDDKFGSFDQIFSPILDIIEKDCLQKLPTEFCNHIIQKYFLVNKEATKNDSVYKFVIKFLIYHDTVNKFEIVFKILQKYKLEFWNRNISLVERNNIYQFFKAFYKLACEKEVTVEFIIRFTNNWESIFSPTDAFKEFIILNLLQFKKKSDQNLELYSEKIVTFSKKIYSEFGQMVFPVFADTLYQFINCEKEKDRIDLLLNMLKFDNTSLNCILVMDLIIRKGDLIYDNKIKNIYHDIHSILKVAVPNVPLYYNLLLKNIRYFE